LKSLRNVLGNAGNSVRRSIMGTLKIKPHEILIPQGFILNINYLTAAINACDSAQSAFALPTAPQTFDFQRS